MNKYGTNSEAVLAVLDTIESLTPEQRIALAEEARRNAEDEEADTALDLAFDRAEEAAYEQDLRRDPDEPISVWSMASDSFDATDVPHGGFARNAAADAALAVQMFGHIDRADYDTLTLVWRNAGLTLPVGGEE